MRALPDRYFGGIESTLGDSEFRRPLEFVPPMQVLMPEHSLTALAQRNPDLAAGVMHSLVHVEHRKVDLEFAKFEWEREKERLMLEAQETAQRFALLRAVIELRPGENKYTLREGGFLFGRTTQIKIGGRRG